jgi:hypothetical protein
VDVGFHHGAIRAQFAPLRYFQLGGQLDQSLIEPSEGVWLDYPGPANKGGIIRHIFQIDPAELPQHQTVTYLILGLFVAQTIQVFDRQHALHHLYRGRVAARLFGMRKAFGKILPDHLVQFLVLQHLVDLGQDRIHLMGQF